MASVEPVYPRKARLANIQGVVKVVLILSEDSSLKRVQSVSRVQGVSGDPFLVDVTIEAVRQWRFLMPYINGHQAAETEVHLSFTFKIEDPPRPAYLHLTDGRVIRADKVREFTDKMEYSVRGHIHYIPPDLVAEVSQCARISILPKLKEGDCVPSGGPSFVVRAIPLLPATKTTVPPVPLRQ